jgi:hypothetical protein
MQDDNTGFRSPTRYQWMIIAYGAMLRLAQYLSNRSLWLDESKLALNIINRSFVQLLKPLDYAQGAPLGFLMLERSAVQVLGPGEYALRFFPFLAGVISLLLFYQLAKQSVSSRAVTIALGLFALSAPLIYFSSEAKQYSGDMAIALLLLLSAIYCASHKLTLWRATIFGLLGAASIWFSHPAVFVLAGVGMSSAWPCRGDERWSRIGTFSIAFTLWGLSFGICYQLFLRHLNADHGLLDYWNYSFPPSHLFSVAAVEWFTSNFFGIFQYPVGLELSGIAAFAFLVGCFAMVSHKRQELSILLSPILVALVAAWAHKYPFNGRLLLFAVPALLLIIAEGVDWIRCKTAEEPVIGACLFAVLFFNPLLFSSYHLVKPSLREEIKPVMNYVDAHARAGDLLYIHCDATPAFRYYTPRFRFSNVYFNEGAFPRNPDDSLRTYESDVNQLPGDRRVWVLFSLGVSDAAANEEKLFLYFMDKRGTRVDHFESVGAATYLYDLNSTPTRP